MGLKATYKPALNFIVTKLALFLQCPHVTASVALFIYLYLFGVNTNRHILPWIVVLRCVC